MHRLETVSVLPELACEPVEQLGMRWFRAVTAKVRWRGDNSGAKVVLPQTIDHHARSQGIFRRGEPVCQFGSTLCFPAAQDGRCGSPDHRFHKTWFHFFAGTTEFASQKDARRRRRRVSALKDRICFWLVQAHAAFEVFDSGVEFYEPARMLGIHFLVHL